MVVRALLTSPKHQGAPSWRCKDSQPSTPQIHMRHPCRAALPIPTGQIGQILVRFGLAWVCFGFGWVWFWVGFGFGLGRLSSARSLQGLKASRLQASEVPRLSRLRAFKASRLQGFKISGFQGFDASKNQGCSKASGFKALPRGLV